MPFLAISMSIASSLRLVAQAIFFCIVLIASCILSAKLFGHSLSIRRVRLGLFTATLYKSSYSHRSDLSISSSKIRIRLHFPRPSNPRWATITTHDYDYRDPICHVSLLKLHATLWVFPVIFRHTQGTWVTAELHDFRLLVFTSRGFPAWVAALRKNLISTILTGELLRLDDFKTTVILGHVASTQDIKDYAGPVEGPQGQDEARVSASAKGYHARNWQSRVYTFARIDAQLRRSWVDDRGSFVMIAEESRWTKVQPSVERAVSSIQTPLWSNLLTAFLDFPSDLLRVYMNPMSAVDLYVPRVDVTFDDFRIRDAELVRQVATLIEERKGAFMGFAWDMAVSVLLTMSE